MRKGFFNYLILAVFALSAAFTSCDKNTDDDNNGNGNGNGNGNTVKELVLEAKDVINTPGNVITARVRNLHRVSAKYENNGFKLTLPELKSDELLSVTITQGEELFGFNFPVSLEGLTISDREARIKTVIIEACDADNIRVGYFLQMGIDIEAGPCYSYSDRDVTIKGKVGSYDVDFIFKKGWNTWYAINNLRTSQKPSADFRWTFAN